MPDGVLPALVGGVPVGVVLVLVLDVSVDGLEGQVPSERVLERVSNHEVVGDLGLDSAVDGRACL